MSDNECFSNYVETVFDDEAPIDTQMKQTREYLATLREFVVENRAMIRTATLRLKQLEKSAGF